MVVHSGKQRITIDLCISMQAKHHTFGVLSSDFQEFSCQEVRESSDDMVIFFATNSDMRRFLSILETMWHSKNVNSITLRYTKCLLNGTTYNMIFSLPMTYFRIYPFRWSFYQLMILFRVTAANYLTV